MLDTKGYEFGPFRLIPSRRVLLRHDSPITLTPKAFDTLVALIERRDRVVTRDELLNQLWPGVSVEEANLTQQIFLVRKAFDESGADEQFIATVPRRGYRFVKDVTLVPQDRSLAEPSRERPARFRLPSVTGGFAAIALTAAVAQVAFLRSPNLPLSTIRPFATAEAVESMPAWSPDGRTIAYGAEVDGHYQIHIQPVDSSTPTPVQLTNIDSDCLFPAWDPVGTRIFFLVTRQRQPREIWVVDVAGGEPQRVVENAINFAVEPNTGAIAFLRRTDQGGALWQTDTRGGGPRFLGRPDVFLGNQSYLSFSRDGRWLGIANASGFVLIPHPFNESSLANIRMPRFIGPEGEVRPYFFFAWLPERDRIVFSARDGAGDAQLWVGDVSQLTARPLEPSPHWDLLPAVSRDGHIAFTATPMDFDILEISLASPRPRQLIAGGRFDGWMDWMPHGRELIFSTQRNGGFEIWRRDIDAGVDRVVVTPSAFPDGRTNFLAQSDVSSDGTRLAFKRDAHIYLQSIAGTLPIRLTNAAVGPREDNPTWSSDDRWVLFRRNFNSVMKAPATGQAAAVLLTEDSATSITAEPKWAGDDVVFVSLGGVRRIGPNGGPSHLVTREQPIVWDVTRDGRTAFAILEGSRRAMRLVRIDLTSGDVRDIAELGRIPLNPMPIGYLAALQVLRVSPDGTRLALSRMNPRSDIFIREFRRASTR